MFLVLGAVTVVGPDGQVVALSDRQRSLLASLLAGAGAVVSVDSLVDLVWPEDPPQDPVAALHNQVSRLRRALPFTAIETVAPGYRLAVGPDDVDSQRFDRLMRADTAGSLSEALSLWARCGLRRVRRVASGPVRGDPARGGAPAGDRALA
jgi:DNA-binding SARP family transcriptional activator